MAKIKFRNFWIWFSDQVKRKTFIRNFFITRNAWGAFSINSHINQHTGQPKVTYNTVETARKSAEKWEQNIILIFHITNVYSVMVIILVKIETIKLITINNEKISI